MSGDLKLFLDGCCCWEGSVGGVGGFAFTGVFVGAVVGTVVEGFGDMEVGVELIVAGGVCVGIARVDFNDAAIDSILFSKVAPKRCSKACRPKVEGLVDVV